MHIARQTNDGTWDTDSEHVDIVRVSFDANKRHSRRPSLQYLEKLARMDAYLMHHDISNKHSIFDI